MSKTVLKKKMDPLSPLAELRKITQLSQGKFSRLIGISFDLVQSVEGGRARATENLLLRVRIETGATWNKEKGCWVVDSAICHYLGVPEKTPLTFPLYEQFRVLRTLHVPEGAREYDLSRMFKWVTALAESVPPYLWIEFAQRYGEAMEGVLHALLQKAREMDEDQRETHEAIVENINAQWQAVSKKALEEKEAKERAVAGRGGHRGVRPHGASPTTSAKR
jgi:transcriptional regulator with XRE-family HTH domain